MRLLFDPLMAKSNLLNTQTVNYLELIGNGKSYCVPPYQRDYSWSEEEWEDLWDDIAGLRSDTESRHYLGALVIEGTSDRQFMIIDGQQRLATLSLLSLAVINHLDGLAKNGIDAEDNEIRAQELRNRFVGEKDPASLVESSRLYLNETDNAFYQDYLIQCKPPLNPRKLPRSNRLLWQCFQYFTQRIQELDEAHNNGESIASLLSETAARQLLFILIIVDDQLNAYTVFETLNARGVELTTTDLLKNYLFSLVNVGADLEAVQRRWKSLIETVGQTHFPEFLRYHLLCEHRKIRSQQLFKLVRKQTKTAENVFALLDDLEKRSELFAAILDPGHGYWVETPDAKPHVGELALFRIRQPIPLLFTAWEQFSKEDFVRVMKLVTVISFRYTVISGLNTNLLEPTYHETAKAVTEGKATTPAKVFEYLKPIYVGDEKMRQDFALLEINTRSRKKLTKYLLARLEEHLSGRACNPDTDPSTIEHILPENPTETWRDTFSPEKWENEIYRLGNLTLLEASINRTIGNKSYATKRDAYVQSMYLLTQKIPEIAPEQWTPELINARQEKLSKIATQVWKSDFA